jgi:hypothetical protein
MRKKGHESGKREEYIGEKIGAWEKTRKCVEKRKS